MLTAYPSRRYTPTRESITICIGSLVLLFHLSSCTSAPTYEDSAKMLGRRLLGQLETRADLRSVRLYIADIVPCERLRLELTRRFEAVRDRPEDAAPQKKHGILPV